VRPLPDRVEARAGGRFHASTDELIILAGIDEDDSDLGIGAKLDALTDKYPDISTSGALFDSIHAEAAARNAAAISRLFRR
jgi:hypothetical protein